MRFREQLKRSLPKPILGSIQGLKRRLAAPPLEEIVLHDYEMVADQTATPRLTLVIPSVAPEKTFGGILTGIDIFMEMGARNRVDLRIILDEMGPIPKGNIIAERASKFGLDPKAITIVPRLAEVPKVEVRAKEVFLTYNWWTNLNVQKLVGKQSHYFGMPPHPTVYLIQEYEPFFHPFSSTHMIARQAFGPPLPCWGIFNSGELYAYFSAQGHKLEKNFVFEPQLNHSLRDLLAQAPRRKEKRILVYGRPAVARNCYPAVEKALRSWTARFPQYSDWEVLSAGLYHAPIELAPGRVMKSAGKLDMTQYGELLLRTGVGLSLMSSPHPSYPPLEMAHFGLWTVTNDYAYKDLARSHENIISVGNIAPDTVADALALACGNVESDPQASWKNKSLRPSFLESRPFAFLDELSRDLQARVWN